MRPAAAGLALALALASCGGTTGGRRFYFVATAAGPADAVKGSPLTFTTTRGWAVRLDRAQLWIGGVYLNQRSPPQTTADPSCFLEGVYAGQVTTGRVVDALDPSPQPFPVVGAAVEGAVRAGELWLTGGAVDAIEDGTVILDAAGEARRGAELVPFAARVTIGSNRKLPAPTTVTPGMYPICRQRIVSPIPVDLGLREGGSLEVRVDPRAWFANVDFAALPPAEGTPPVRSFRDDLVETPSIALFNALHARSGVYTLTWKNP